MTLSYTFVTYPLSPQLIDEGRSLKVGTWNDALREIFHSFISRGCDRYVF